MKNPKLFESVALDMEGRALEHGSEITLLDLFAGMAMAGAIDAANFTVGAEKVDKVVAFRAYEIAKAMLEEREENLKGESNA